MSKENHGDSDDDPKSMGAHTWQYKSYENNYTIWAKNCETVPTHK